LGPSHAAAEENPFSPFDEHEAVGRSRAGCPEGSERRSGRHEGRSAGGPLLSNPEITNAREQTFGASGMRAAYYRCRRPSIWATAGGLGETRPRRAQVPCVGKRAQRHDLAAEARVRFSQVLRVSANLCACKHSCRRRRRKLRDRASKGPAAGSLSPIGGLVTAQCRVAGERDGRARTTARNRRDRFGGGPSRLRARNVSSYRSRHACLAMHRSFIRRSCSRFVGRRACPEGAEQ
jgi:hypothetical protein